MASLWLHAVFVSPASATVLGGICVTLRTIYPFLLGKNVSKTQSKRVAAVTMPAYLIIFYLIGSTVAAAFAG